MVINSVDGTGTNSNFFIDLVVGVEPKVISLLSANIPTDTNNTSGGFYYLYIPEFGVTVKNSAAESVATFAVPNHAALGSRAIYNEALNFTQNSSYVSGSAISRLTVIIKNADGSIATDMGAVQIIVKLTY